jgi:hypothetical protein
VRDVLPEPQATESSVAHSSPSSAPHPRVALWTLTGGGARRPVLAHRSVLSADATRHRHTWPIRLNEAGGLLVPARPLARPPDLTHQSGREQSASPVASRAAAVASICYSWERSLSRAAGTSESERSDHPRRGRARGERDRPGRQTRDAGRLDPPAPRDRRRRPYGRAGRSVPAWGAAVTARKPRTPCRRGGAGRDARPARDPPRLGEVEHLAVEPTHWKKNRGAMGRGPILG